MRLRPTTMEHRELDQRFHWSIVRLARHLPLRLQDVRLSYVLSPFFSIRRLRRIGGHQFLALNVGAGARFRRVLSLVLLVRRGVE